MCEVVQPMCCQAPKALRTPYHVLLVEDDATTRMCVEQLLRKCEYQVTTAANGKEAMDVLHGCRDRPKVDLILTDIFMPEMDGMELINAVSNGSRWPAIPVVVMSAREEQTQVLEAFEAGASDYLIKPIRRNELSTLWQHIWKSARFASPGATPSVSGTPPAAGDGLGCAPQKNSSNESTSQKQLDGTTQPAAAAGTAEEGSSAAPAAAAADSRPQHGSPAAGTAGESAGLPAAAVTKQGLHQSMQAINILAAGTSQPLGDEPTVATHCPQSDAAAGTTAVAPGRSAAAAAGAGWGELMVPPREEAPASKRLRPSLDLSQQQQPSVDMMRSLSLEEPCGHGSKQLAAALQSQQGPTSAAADQLARGAAALDLSGQQQAQQAQQPQQPQAMDVAEAGTLAGVAPARCSDSLNILAAVAAAVAADDGLAGQDSPLHQSPTTEAAAAGQAGRPQRLRSRRSRDESTVPADSWGLPPASAGQRRKGLMLSSHSAFTSYTVLMPPSAADPPRPGSNLQTGSNAPAAIDAQQVPDAYSNGVMEAARQAAVPTSIGSGCAGEGPARAAAAAQQPLSQQLPAITASMQLSSSTLPPLSEGLTIKPLFTGLPPAAEAPGSTSAAAAAAALAAGVLGNGLHSVNANSQHQGGLRVSGLQAVTLSPAGVMGGVSAGQPAGSDQASQMLFSQKPVNGQLPEHLLQFLQTFHAAREQQLQQHHHHHHQQEGVSGAYSQQTPAAVAAAGGGRSAGRSLPTATGLAGPPGPYPGAQKLSGDVRPSAGPAAAAGGWPAPGAQQGLEGALHPAGQHGGAHPAAAAAVAAAASRHFASQYGHHGAGGAISSSSAGSRPGAVGAGTAGNVAAAAGAAHCSGVFSRPGMQPAASAAAAARSAALARFREKRARRNYAPQVRYESRKRLAQSRPRIKGQFVKQEVAAAHSLAALAEQAAIGDSDE